MIDFDTVANMGCIELEPSKDGKGNEKRGKMQFGIQVMKGEGDFNRTNVIIITPRYVIVNRLGQPIVAKVDENKQVLITNDTNMIHFSFSKQH